MNAVAGCQEYFHRLISQYSSWGVHKHAAIPVGPLSISWSC